MSQQSSLTQEESQRVKEALRKLLDNHESQAELAKSLIMPDGHSVSQQVVSSAMNGDKPAGVSLARAVAQAMGITFDELVSGRRLVTGAAALERNENVPGWKEAAAEVLEKKYAPRHAVAAAAKMFVTVRPTRMTAQLVYDLALLWMRHAPLDVRIAAENAEVEEDLGRAAEEEEHRHRPVVRSGERLTESGVMPRPVARPRKGR